MIITAVSKKDAWQTSNDEKHSKYFDILKKPVITLNKEPRWKSSCQIL